jgi:HD-like signal output (HDOD) protein
MRAPLHILVIEEDPDILEAHLKTLDRIGHFGHGIERVEDARGRRGRFSPEMMLFSVEAWEDGGPDLVKAFAERDKFCRVLLAGDHHALGRSPEFIDQGAQGVLLEPLSTAELARAVDGLMEGPPADVLAAAEERLRQTGEQAIVDDVDDDGDEAPAAPEPDDPEAARRRRKTRDRILKLADRLRAGEGKVTNISPVAMELQGLCSSDDAPSLNALVAKIEQDPNLAGAVLRASNTAAYRGMPGVVDLVAAGRRLGTRRMGEVAQMEAIKGAFVAKKGSGWSRLLSRMWRNTVVTAHTARKVAETMGLASRGEVYSMALFHNLGEVMIADLHRQMGEPAPRNGYVQGALKDDIDRQHPAIGALLLKSWGMPLALARIAFAHHDPSVLPSGTPLARHAWLVGGAHRAVIDAGYDYKKPAHDEGPPVAAAAVVLGVKASDFKEAAEESIEWWTGRDDAPPT